jgi:hypothetical protein
MRIRVVRQFSKTRERDVAVTTGTLSAAVANEVTSSSSLDDYRVGQGLISGASGCGHGGASLVPASNSLRFIGTAVGVGSSTHIRPSEAARHDVA